jgi:myo-inositol-1(or 4)-monophosphatase
MEQSNELKFAIDLAQEAGSILMSYHGKIIDYQVKEMKGILTKADLESDEYIREKIDRTYPEHNVLSEELEEKSLSSDYTWIVDPLDGTSNFLKGNPLFSVSIALAFQNHPIVGVVYNPYNKELFFAEKGKGAFLNGHSIRVSELSDLKRCIISIGANFSNPEGQKKGMEILNKLAPPTTYRFRVNESSALSLCYVGAGRFDGFVDPDINPWDMAAGGLIAQEAGGCVTDFSGNAWNPYCAGVLAANGKINDMILKILG